MADAVGERLGVLLSTHDMCSYEEIWETLGWVKTLDTQFGLYLDEFSLMAIGLANLPKVGERIGDRDLLISLPEIRDLRQLPWYLEMVYKLRGVILIVTVGQGGEGESIAQSAHNASLRWVADVRSAGDEQIGEHNLGWINTLEKLANRNTTPSGLVFNKNYPTGIQAGHFPSEGITCPRLIYDRFHLLSHAAGRPIHPLKFGPVPTSIGHSPATHEIVPLVHIIGRDDTDESLHAWCEKRLAI